MQQHRSLNLLPALVLLTSAAPPLRANVMEFNAHITHTVVRSPDGSSTSSWTMTDFLREYWPSFAATPPYTLTAPDSRLSSTGTLLPDGTLLTTPGTATYPTFHDLVAAVSLSGTPWIVVRNPGTTPREAFRIDPDYHTIPESSVPAVVFPSTPAPADALPALPTFTWPANPLAAHVTVSSPTLSLSADLPAYATAWTPPQFLPNGPYSFELRFDAPTYPTPGLGRQDISDPGSSTITFFIPISTSSGASVTPFSVIPEPTLPVAAASLLLFARGRRVTATASS